MPQVAITSGRHPYQIAVHAAAVVAGLLMALRMELGGVLLLASGASMYAFALLVVSGVQGMVAGALVSGIAVGSWWRAD